jgi:hypothetical protein
VRPGVGDRHLQAVPSSVVSLCICRHEKLPSGEAVKALIAATARNPAVDQICNAFKIDPRAEATGNGCRSSITHEGWL